MYVCRYVLRRQLDRLMEMGYTICTGIENEFILYEKGTKTPVFKGNPIFDTVVTSKHASLNFISQLTNAKNSQNKIRSDPRILYTVPKNFSQIHLGTKSGMSRKSVIHSL